MGGIRMSEGMHGGSFVDPSFLQGCLEGALHPAFTHGLLALSYGRGKHPEWMAMSQPVLAQHFQTSHGQGDTAILASFPLLDMQQLAFPIDLFDLQLHPFQQTQPTGVDRGETNSIWATMDMCQDTAHFCPAEHHWQLLLFERTQKFEGLPVSPQCPFKEE